MACNTRKLTGELPSTSQPPIKRTIADAFERMQEPKRYDFTRPQGGVGMFGDVVQVRIDLTK
jgi:hypothetical protein